MDESFDRISPRTRQSLSRNTVCPPQVRSFHEQQSDPGTFGAALTLKVAREGVYEVALSEAAWIDLVKDGVPTVSPAHRHGPECSTVSKVVTFDLMTGTYTLQISGSKRPAATVIVYRPGL
jgi:hypothetical protein